MGRRVLLVALVAAAPAADSVGAHRLAFWSLVLALPLGAVCGLASFAAFLDDRDDLLVSLQALLWAPALALLLAAAAVRGPAVATADVPQLAVSAVVGCLALLALKALVFSVARLYRERPLGAARA